MLGSTSFLALCLLTASPAGSAFVTDAPNSVVTRAAFQAETRLAATGNGQSTSTMPARLPYDPAYDAKEPLLAQNPEGIPGLPPVPEQIPLPKDATEQPDDNLSNIMLNEPGESEACEPIHGRTWRQRGLRGWLDGVSWDAWVDQGVTLNDLSPRDRTNGPVTFNDRSNDYQLNQTYLRLKRDIDPACDRWQIGGRVDLLYGADAIYTEARGLEVTDELAPKWNAQRYGLAMPQMYAEVFAPWGTGITMKLGHFYSDFGYESVAAPDNFFYSHSYVFQYGEPKTYTGLLGETKLGDFTIEAGMTRGWDNWEDENNDLAFTGGIRWTSANQRTTIAVNVDAGREQPDASTNVRTLYSLIIQQKLGQCWQYVIQHDYGNEPGAGVGGRAANWYGVNQYLFYTFNQDWKAGMQLRVVPRRERRSRAGRPSNGRLLRALPRRELDAQRPRHGPPRTSLGLDRHIQLLSLRRRPRSNQLLLGCDVVLKF